MATRNQARLRTLSVMELLLAVQWPSRRGRGGAQLLHDRREIDPHVLAPDQTVGRHVEHVQQAKVQAPATAWDPERRTRRGALPQALVDDEIRPVVAAQRRHLV